MRISFQLMAVTVTLATVKVVDRKCVRTASSPSTTNATDCRHLTLSKVFRILRGPNQKRRKNAAPEALALFVCIGRR
jgi:hypothetical protein